MARHLPQFPTQLTTVKAWGKITPSLSFTKQNDPTQLFRGWEVWGTPRRVSTGDTLLPSLGEGHG